MIRCELVRDGGAKSFTELFSKLAYLDFPALFLLGNLNFHTM